ncbi:MAG: hypothetical protein ACI85Q_002515 [Salibacteraceae bacterium]|jgi:hypothetical protein
MRNISVIWEWVIRSKSMYFWLFVLTVLLTNLRQNVVTKFDCEICSDKARYFMYLPAAFYYGFEASQFPKDKGQRTGNGFYLDSIENKTITKFTSGIAILQLPFYGLGFIVDSIFSLEQTPFSKYYLVWVSLGSSFYLVLGLFYLKQTLALFYSEKTAMATSFLILLGTNLLYYTIDENLMSHLYSFTLCCIFSYNLLIYLKEGRNSSFVTFTIALAFAIWVRPTNALFAPLSIFIGLLLFPNEPKQLLPVFTIKKILVAIVVLITVFIPQMVYWKYVFGHWVVWSYNGQAFTHILTPYFLEVWFSPQGGLFTYTPLILTSIFTGGYMIMKKNHQGWLVIGSFLMISYLCASWNTPFFGECNFGKRPFIEFYLFLSLALAYLIQNIKKTTAFRIPILLIIRFCVYFNLTVIGVFDTYFFGSTWDGSSYVHLLGKGLILIR